MEHFWQNVPGWAAFRSLYADMVRRAPPSGAHFVEVGSFAGRSAAFMAVEIINSGKQIKFDCVDPFEGSPETSRAIRDLGRPLWDEFCENIAPVRAHITVHRMPSVEAAMKYPGDSLDFVFIDGDHSYEHVFADIRAWLPRIRAGGVIAGDDYDREGVRRAVQQSFARTRTIEARPKDDKPSCQYWIVRL